MSASPPVFVGVHDTAHDAHPTRKIAYSSFAFMPSAERPTPLCTFVCVPGLGDLRTEYRFLAPLLSGLGRVLAADLRGTGDSDDTFHSHTPEDCGRDILDLLEKEAVTDAVLIGCSMTGASVLYAAKQAPKRVRGCILINPFAWEHPMPFGMATLISVLLGNSCTGPSFWASFYKGLYPRAADVPDLPAYCAELKAHFTPYRRRVALKQMMLAQKEWYISAAPVLGLYGSKDPDFAKPEEEAKELVQRLTPGQGSYLMMEGCGHYPHVEAPAQVMAAIAAFCEQRVGARA